MNKILGIMDWGNSVLDYSTPWQLGFQYPASPLMYGIIELHNHICFFLIITLVIIIYLLIFILKNHTINQYNNSIIFSKVKDFYNVKIGHNPLFETIWIIIPSLILLAIIIPSFSLLYAIEVPRETFMTLKVTGHQWYWSYEVTMDQYFMNTESNSRLSIRRNISDLFSQSIPILSEPKDTSYFYTDRPSINFDSYMVPDNEISNKGLRLLETTVPLILPTNTNVRVLVTADDVLHCWAIPSLGIKIDGCPGRLNQIMLYIERIGHFYGQCSELCGANHGFMPIEIYSINKQDFITYFSLVSENYNKLLVTSSLEKFTNFLPNNFSISSNSSKKTDSKEDKDKKKNVNEIDIEPDTNISPFLFTIKEMILFNIPYYWDYRYQNPNRYALYRLWATFKNYKKID